MAFLRVEHITWALAAHESKLLSLGQTVYQYQQSRWNSESSITQEYTRKERQKCAVRVDWSNARSCHLAKSHITLNFATQDFRAQWENRVPFASWGLYLSIFTKQMYYMYLVRVLNIEFSERKSVTWQGTFMHLGVGVGEWGGSSLPSKCAAFPEKNVKIHSNKTLKNPTKLSYCRKIIFFYPEYSF